MKERREYSRFVQNVYGWQSLPKGNMIQLLHHCVEHDITTFDTADLTGGNYVNGNFGTALSESGLSRDEIQLLSKFRFNTNAEHLKKTVDDLLLDLRIDYLDLLLLDSESPTEEEVQTLERLYSQGKILEIGSLQPPKLPLLNMGIPIVAQQIASPLTKMKEYELNSEKILDEKISIFAWWEPEEVMPQESFRVLEELQKKYQVEKNQLLLAWLLRHPAHLHPILSASEQSNIDKMTAAKEVELDSFDWQKISLIL